MQLGGVAGLTLTPSVIQIIVFGIFYKDGGGAGPEGGGEGGNLYVGDSLVFPVFPCKAARWSCWSHIDSFYNGE